MKAVTYQAYGPPDVLQIEELPAPSPGPNELLVRTHATTVTSGDWRVRSLSMPRGFGMIARLMFGVSKPRQPIIGSELAGIVEATGTGVTNFSPGDRVFVFTGSTLGCYVGLKCIPKDGNVVRAPEGLSLPEAAALSFGGTTSLDFFRKGQLSAGDEVLINGASGGVGTAAIQIAKHFEATVTAVCSARNFDLVKSLGADHVIDYREHDFAEQGRRYDIIMDTVGNAPFARSKQVLKDNGRLLLVLGGLADMLRAPVVSLLSKRRIIAGGAAERLDDLQLLAQLAVEGRFKPVVDREFPLEEIVEAHRYVDSGRKRGNVVVTWPLA